MPPTTRSQSKVKVDTTVPAQEFEDRLLKVKTFKHTIEPILEHFIKYLYQEDIEVPSGLLEKFFDNSIIFPVKKEVDPKERKYRQFQKNHAGPFSNADLETMKMVKTSSTTKDPEKQNEQSPFHSILENFKTQFKTDHFPDVPLSVVMVSKAIYYSMRESVDNDDLTAFLDDPDEDNLTSFISSNEERIVEIIQDFKDHNKELRERTIERNKLNENKSEKKKKKNKKTSVQIRNENSDISENEQEQELCKFDSCENKTKNGDEFCLKHLI